MAIFIHVVLIPLKDIIQSRKYSEMNINEPLVIDLRVVCNCSSARNAIFENTGIVIAQHGWQLL
jgi:hypothetical protein